MFQSAPEDGEALLHPRGGSRGSEWGPRPTGSLWLLGHRGQHPPPAQTFAMRLAAHSPSLTPHSTPTHSLEGRLPASRTRSRPSWRLTLPWQSSCGDLVIWYLLIGSLASCLPRVNDRPPVCILALISVTQVSTLTPLVCFGSWWVSAALLCTEGIKTRRRKPFT